MPEMSLQHTLGGGGNRLVYKAMFLTNTQQVSSVKVSWDNGCYDVSLLHMPKSLQVNAREVPQLWPHCFQILYNSSFK